MRELRWQPPERYITIEADCATCGERLEVTDATGDGEGSISLEVIPCKSCLKARENEVISEMPLLI